MQPENQKPHVAPSNSIIGVTSYHAHPHPHPATSPCVIAASASTSTTSALFSSQQQHPPPKHQYQHQSVPAPSSSATVPPVLLTSTHPQQQQQSKTATLPPPTSIGPQQGTTKPTRKQYRKRTSTSTASPGTSIHRGRPKGEANKYFKPSHAKGQVGGICRFCKALVRNTQQNGTRYSKHLYACAATPPAVKSVITQACKELRDSVPIRATNPVASIHPQSQPQPQTSQPNPPQPQPQLQPQPQSLADPSYNNNSSIGITAHHHQYHHHQQQHKDSTPKLKRPSPPVGGPTGKTTTNTQYQKRRGATLTSIDHCTVEQAQKIDATLLRAFVLCRIPLHVLEHPAFVDALIALRPGYAGQVFTRPSSSSSKRSRKTLTAATTLLNDFREDIERKVSDLFRNWVTSSKAVLCVYEWSADVESDSNTTSDGRHVVSFFATFGDRTVFLAAVEMDKDSEKMATKAQTIVDLNGGDTFFCAVAADETNMGKDVRDAICNRNPYLLKMEGVSHRARKLLNEISEIRLLTNAFRHATAIARTLRRYPRLRACLATQAQSEQSDDMQEFPPPLEFFDRSTHKGIQNQRLTLLGAFVRSQPALHALAHSEEGQLVTSDMMSDGDVNDNEEAQRQYVNDFRALVLDNSIATNANMALRILTAVMNYARTFSGHGEGRVSGGGGGGGEVVRLSHVVPETMKLHARLEAVCSELDRMHGVDADECRQTLGDKMKRYIPSSLLEQGAVAQANGNGNENENGVVDVNIGRKADTSPNTDTSDDTETQNSLLVQPLHFLAATLDPNVCPQHESGQFFDVSLHALRNGPFLDDKGVWSSAELSQSRSEREKIVTAELALYIAGEGSFRNGGALRRRDALMVAVHSVQDDVKMEQICSKGWWEAFGGSTPHLKAIALTLLSLTPSPCPTSRGETVRNMIQRGVECGATAKRIEDVMYVAVNARIVNDIPETVAGDTDFVSSVLAADRECSNRDKVQEKEEEIDVDIDKIMGGGT